MHSGKDDWQSPLDYGKLTVAVAAKTVQSTGVAAAKTVQATGAAIVSAGKRATHATEDILTKASDRLVRRLPTFSSHGSERIDSSGYEGSSKQLLAQRYLAELVEIKKSSVTVDEGDGDGNLAPRRTFYTLEIETDSHPFFKRSWYIRHHLDEFSPLLSSDVRNLISKNNGMCKYEVMISDLLNRFSKADLLDTPGPQELNDCNKIRENIDFHELIVTFSGVANESGYSVHGMTIYDPVNMAIVSWLISKNSCLV